MQMDTILSFSKIFSPSRFKYPRLLRQHSSCIERCSTLYRSCATAKTALHNNKGKYPYANLKTKKKLVYIIVWNWQAKLESVFICYRPCYIWFRNWGRNCLFCVFMRGDIFDQWKQNALWYSVGRYARSPSDYKCVAYKNTHTYI